MIPAVETEEFLPLAMLDIPSRVSGSAGVLDVVQDSQPQGKL
jgi:hypothetical protein